MILNRLFKPKWQHPDPQIRKQCIQVLDSADPALAELAQQDQEPEVRCAAIAKLAELNLLRQIAEQDRDDTVRKFADNRLRELLSGRAPDSPRLETRLTELQSLQSPYVDYLALQAKESELRLAALQHVANEAVLAEVVINDPVAEVRFNALEKVHDPVILGQIVGLSRNRDKRVSRRIRERLDDLRIKRKRVERIEYLCQEVASLRWDGENGLNAAKFLKLEKEWQELKSFAEPTWQEHYNQARAQFLAQRQASVAKRMAGSELCASLEAFLNTLQTRLELTDELRGSLEQTLEDTRGSWNQLGITDDSEGRRLEQRFAGLIQAIKERERVLERNHERAERLRELLKQAEALLSQPSEVLESNLTTLKHRWSSMERPEVKELALELQTQFDAVVGKLRNRLQRQKELRDQELAEIQNLVNALEKALEVGELQHAITLYEQTRGRLKRNISLSHKQMTALEERLQACVPKLGELRGWRRWGTNRAREQLCEEAEQLIGLQADPEEIAQEVKQLRLAWKALDSSEGSAATKALWKRFDKACEQAYEPCKAYFEAQAKERQNNLAKKQALCERLEHFAAMTDWERVDWQAADRLQREVQNQWAKLGAVPRVERKALERRYNKILEYINGCLQPERERELQRRRDLIQQVQALANSEDWRVAIESTKQAQAEWHPSVQASPQMEQALWRKFRAACDAVFERRKVEQQAAERERQTNLASRIALCEEIEALASVDHEGIGQARRRIQEAREAWALFAPVPKAQYKSLEQRFETACKQFAQHEQELQATQLREELDILRQLAALCSEVEALLGGQDLEMKRAAVERARQQWETLGQVPQAWSKAIRQRFDTACQALLADGGTQQALLQILRANLDSKQTLCLRMEILAGVESPKEFAQARMQYQVLRLSESLHKGSVVESSDEARAIEVQWHLVGLLPPEQNELLEGRFQRALAALRKNRSRPAV
jgi:hypothetical protein